MYSSKLIIKIYSYNDYYVIVIALNRIRNKVINKSKSTKIKVILMLV